MISIIIVAAGSGTRSMLDKNKTLFVLEQNITVIEKTVKAFLNIEDVEQIIVAVNFSSFEEFKQILGKYSIVKLVEGGDSRTQSVSNALSHAKGEITLIHDGARPFVSQDLINRIIDGVKQFKSAIAAIPSNDTIAKVDSDEIIDTFRNGFYRIQTPQGFYTADIKKAYSMIENRTYSDDSAVYSSFIAPSHIVLGEQTNIKLTYPSDFKTQNRVGIGFDLHKLVEGRKLILGGIEIPHTKGLLGHSDADVLTHAIMDALLSACSLRDIGYHFPDNDPEYEGISSIILLEKVLKLVANEGYEVVNISACIMAEKPKLMKFVPEISTNLAKVIHISTSDLGITCTTLEGLGIVGREEGIAVSATCSLKHI